ncbi:hypothetical protein ACU19_04825 [Actinobaculum suis]|uniref:hypothetical protein n=1 Tax=Actinobaculum suis TaxID=1657 RepID=UPI00066FF50F|nr:hypothetical protein [Actinobaculum suis]KMY23301.1 hypothetical protein ACU19_04825 [Actinobaculum suis]
MSKPLRITAILGTPVAGVVTRPFMLDGPLSWVWWAESENFQPALDPNTAPGDADLPLEKWEKHGTWGWCTSEAVYEVTRRTQMEIRRPPADREFARFTKDKKHHHGMGPMKARDTVIPLSVIPKMVWEVLATDPDEVMRLCEQVTHLGGHRARDCGRVESWEFDTPATATGWERRPFPKPGSTGVYRAPYSHPLRRVEVPEC